MVESTLQSGGGIVISPDAASVNSVGASSTDTSFTLKTTSSTARSISFSLKNQTPGFSVLSSVCPTVSKIKTCTIKVRFNPAGLVNGTHSDFLVIEDLEVPLSAILNKPSTNDVSGMVISSGAEENITALDFGIVSLSSSVSKIVILKDPTRKVKENISISSSSPDFNVMTSVCSTVLINGTAGCSVRINFSGSGKAAGTYTANLLIGDKIIPMTAVVQSTPPPNPGNITFTDSVLVQISEYNFGTLIQDEKKTFLLKVKNEGGVSATGVAMVLSGSSAFTVTGSTCTTVLLAGSTCQMTVNVKSAESGEHVGLISYAGKTFNLLANVTGLVCGTGTHMEGGVCMPNQRQCTSPELVAISPNATAGQAVWNAGSSSYNCNITACLTNFSVIANTCASNVYTVHISKNGGGTVSASNFTLDETPEEYDYQYSYGQEFLMTLTAAAQPGHEIDSWGGDCASATGFLCVLPLIGNHNVTLTFKEIPYTLTLTQPLFGGAITGTEAGQKTYNSPIALAVELEPGFKVVSWTGGSCEGQTGLTCDFNIQSSQNISIILGCAAGYQPNGQACELMMVETPNPDFLRVTDLVPDLYQSYVELKNIPGMYEDYNYQALKSAYDSVRVGHPVEWYFSDEFGGISYSYSTLCAIPMQSIADQGLSPSQVCSYMNSPSATNNLLSGADGQQYCRLAHLSTAACQSLVDEKNTGTMVSSVQTSYDLNGTPSSRFLINQPFAALASTNASNKESKTDKLIGNTPQKQFFKFQGNDYLVTTIVPNYNTYFVPPDQTMTFSFYKLSPSGTVLSSFSKKVPLVRTPPLEVIYTALPDVSKIILTSNKMYIASTISSSYGQPVKYDSSIRIWEITETDLIERVFQTRVNGTYPEAEYVKFFEQNNMLKWNFGRLNIYSQNIFTVPTAGTTAQSLGTMDTEQVDTAPSIMWNFTKVVARDSRFGGVQSVNVSVPVKKNTTGVVTNLPNESVNLGSLASSPDYGLFMQDVNFRNNAGVMVKVPPIFSQDSNNLITKNYTGPNMTSRVFYLETDYIHSVTKLDNDHALIQGAKIVFEGTSNDPMEMYGTWASKITIHPTKLAIVDISSGSAVTTVMPQPLRNEYRRYTRSYEMDSYSGQLLDQNMVFVSNVGDLSYEDPYNSYSSEYFEYTVAREGTKYLVVKANNNMGYEYGSNWYIVDIGANTQKPVSGMLPYNSVASQVTRYYMKNNSVFALEDPDMQQIYLRAYTLQESPTAVTATSAGNLDLTSIGYLQDAQMLDFQSQFYKGSLYVKARTAQDVWHSWYKVSLFNGSGNPSLQLDNAAPFDREVATCLFNYDYTYELDSVRAHTPSSIQGMYCGGVDEEHGDYLFFLKR